MMLETTAGFTAWLAASLMLSLRLSPVLLFAPPFTLTPVPPLFRALLAVGLAGLMTAFNPALREGLSIEPGALFGGALRELFLGAVFVMAFQIAFGALFFAGRTVEIQAGLGLAATVDPTTKAQLPLVGTIFALVAGAIFFATGGHLELLRAVSASLEIVPLGQATAPADLGPLTAFIAVCFTAALGVAGGLILTLFLTDAAIAMLSRTAPQINVLLLGFQVKTLLLLFALPATLGVSAALTARLMAYVLQSLVGLI